MKRFSSLLAETCVSCESILHESTSAVPVLFASKVLSIASLLLPSVRNRLYKGMEKLFPASSIKVPDLTQDIFADSHQSVVTPLEKMESPIPRSQSLLELPIPRQPLTLSTRSQGSLSIASEPDSFRPEEEEEWEFPMTSTYDLDVSQEIVIPSSATPTPSPAPQPWKSEFSPVPSKLSPPPEDQDDVGSDVMKLEVMTSSMRVKDYTRISDRMCIRRIREEGVKEEYSSAVSTLPTLFQWSNVMGEETVDGLSDCEWWRER